MVQVPYPLIEELRNELLAFKRAVGAEWAFAAAHVAGAVQALS